MGRKKKNKEIQAYRGHAIERLEQEQVCVDIPEEHGTNTFYECGVSLMEEKEEKT
ncbi:MAG: hypothetical protein OEV21_03985 [Thermoplasmata archaeon]|nr:hypothetical protein [Thermoplasmata archaeon]